MNDAGLPIGSAPACPFVAFEDDRDRRGTAPDHRHRCFAEPRPAPRALAHQEAYCLSSAFPVCPTFQDWARREAAAALPGPGAGAAPRDAAPGFLVAQSGFEDSDRSARIDPADDRPDSEPDVDADDADSPDDDGWTDLPVGAASPVMPPAIPPRQRRQRDWAAPPPWTGGESPAGRDAERVAEPPGTLNLDPKPAPSSVSQPDEWASASRGLAGSAAHRLAGPDPDEPAGARPIDERDDALDSWAAGAAGAAAAGRHAASSRAPGESAARTGEPAPAPARSAQRRTPRSGEGQQPVQQDPSELFGPAWERPRRYEAYPTLRTRIGLPSVGGVPRPAIYALLLLVAALLLFLVGPRLLGFGGVEQGIAGATQTPVPTEASSASILPTVAPEPTPGIYLVAKGDTMSKIAQRHALTLEALMAANPKIKNPNKIKIGDQVIIPLPVTDGGGDGSAGASPSP